VSPSRASSGSFLRPFLPSACYAGYRVGSLRSRRNLISVTPRSLFWASNINELPEVRFEPSFILIGKSTMGFTTNQSWRVIKSWYTGGGPEQIFRRYFAQANRVGCRQRRGRFHKLMWKIRPLHRAAHCAPIMDPVVQNEDHPISRSRQNRRYFFAFFRRAKASAKRARSTRRAGPVNFPLLPPSLAWQVRLKNVKK